MAALFGCIYADIICDLVLNCKYLFRGGIMGILS